MGKYFSVRGRDLQWQRQGRDEIGVMTDTLRQTPNRKTIREVFEDLRRTPTSFSPPEKGDQIEVWRTFRHKRSSTMKAKLHRYYVWSD